MLSYKLQKEYNQIETDLNQAGRSCFYSRSYPDCTWLSDVLKLFNRILLSEVVNKAPT